MAGPARDHLCRAGQSRYGGDRGGAGAEITVGRRMYTVRQGPGKAAWPERWETEGMGLCGLTTDDLDETPEHRHQANRRDFQPNPIHAVVVRQWHNREDGPGI